MQDPVNKRYYVSMFVFRSVLRDVVYTLCLLLRLVGLNRRQPLPTRRQSLIGGKPLHGHLALQVNLEHYLELSYRSLIHLDRSPPKLFHPRGSEWQTVGLKDVYGIHCCHLQSIVFHCSSVHCLCPSTC